VRALGAEEVGGGLRVVVEMALAAAHCGAEAVGGGSPLSSALLDVLGRR
jgi:hypothetical protein